MAVITKSIAGMGRILLSSVIFTATLAAAQIVPNAAMPEATRAEVLQTANGLPQVNIRQPNNAGVSLNNYSQFDVQRNGAILNNALTHTQTRLAGWVAGNPLLNGKSADVIVNQVQSVNPSFLRGHLEVAGKQAQVVVANPVGITCEGCGFINADRVALGTGQVQLNPTSGALDHFVVRDGTVTLDGMDASNTSYTQILARAVQVKGKVWGKKLDITTGPNTVNQQTGAVTPLAADTANTPGAAIDVANLGGMYAGQINLLATEHGVGVRNAGDLGADGTLTLSASGKLANTGHIRSDQAMRIESKGVDNSGRLYARGSLSIDSLAEIRSRGSLISGQDLHLRSDDKSGGVTLDEGSLTAAGVDPAGKIQSGELRIETQAAATLHGRTLSGNRLTVSASSIKGEGADMQSGAIQLQASSGALDLPRARVKANSVSLATASGLVNDEGRIEAGNLTLRADQLSNRKGSVLQIGPGAATITVAQGIDNRKGLIGSQSADLLIQAGELDNRAGRIEHGGSGAAHGATDPFLNGADLTLTTVGQLDNTGGTIQSTQSITLTAGGVNNADGVVRAGHSIKAALTAAKNGRDPSQANGVLSNLNGLISAEKPIMIQAHAIDNSNGVMAGSSDITLNANAVTNRDGRIQSLGQISANVSGKLDNAEGALRSAKDVIVTARELNNQNTKTPAAQGDQEKTAPKGIEGRNVLVNASRVDNQHGSMLAGDSLKINATDLIDNRFGTLSAVNSVVLVDRHRNANDRASGLYLDNEQGAITSGNSLWLNLAGLRGNGMFYGAQSLGLALSGDYAHTANLSAPKSLVLDVAGTLTNMGSLQSGESLTVSGTNITNTASARIVARKTRLNTGGTLYNEGLINGDNTRIEAGRIHNAGGRIYGTELGLQTGQLLNQAILRDGTRVAGTIAARQALAVGADTLDNTDDSLIYSGGRAVFGRWLAAQNKVQGSMQRFTNSAARIDIAGDGRINTRLFQNLNPGYRTGLVTVSTRLRTLYQPDTFSEPPDEDKAILIRGKDFNRVLSEDDNKYPWAFWGNPIEPKFAKRFGHRWLGPSGPEFSRRPMGFGEPFQVELASRFYKKYVVPGYDAFQGGKVIPAFYTLGYAPNDPIWGILGLTPPSADVPEQHIKVCNYGQCETKISPAFEKYLKDNPSYEKLNVILRGYNWHVRKLIHGNYNIYYFNETLSRSQVLASTPAQLNVGGNLALEGSQFVNDKSQVRVGGQLTGSVRQFTNIGDTTAVERLERFGTKQRHELHRWSDQYSDPETYNPVIERHITLPSTIYDIGRGNKVAGVSLEPVMPDGTQPVTVQAIGKDSPVDVITVPKPGKGQEQLVIRTLNLRLEVPKASLFQLNPGAPDRPLIETDPAFSNYEKWIGSDYMLAQLGLAGTPSMEAVVGIATPNVQNAQRHGYILKRLGDGYYEARLVADQIGQLTGRRFLAGHDSDLTQYRALMDSGITFARTHHLRPGIALTAEQMQALTSDIVWLVEKSVTLPDGTTTTVLAPQVYVRVGIRTGDKQTGLQKIFDAENVQKEVAAQVAITKEFGARASKAIGDYADSRLMQAAALQRQALNTTDPVQRDRLLAQAANITDTWGEGGTGRVLAHGIVGGLTGNVAGAAGAVASQLTAPAIHKALNRADIPKDLRDALVAVGSNVVGAAAGGAAGQGGIAAGIATAHNATLNNFLKHDEVKRFARQLKECSGNAQCQQQVLAEAAAVSALNDSVLRDCKASGSCEQLIAEYREGEAAFADQIMATTADTQLLEKLMSNQPLAAAIIRGKLYDKVDTSPEGLARAQRLEGYAKAVAGMTAAGAAVESIQGIVQVVDALERGQLDQLVVQYLRGIKDLPQAVKAKLGSGDAAQIAEGVATALKTVHPKNLISGLKSVTREPHALKKIEKLSNEFGVSSTKGGFLSTSKVIKHSLLDGKLNAAERNWAKQISNGFDKKGELSEKLVNSVARRQGYKLLDGKYGGNKGFDHVLVGKDGVVIIVETKQFASKGAIQLGLSGPNNKVVQLENVWVNNVLQNLPQESPARTAVERANLSGNLKRVIAGFNRETGNLHFIPVKPNTK